MSGVGWRLTMEPCGALVAWALVRVDEEHPEGRVSAGLIEDAVRLRDLALRLADLHGTPMADPISEANAARELGLGLIPSALRHDLRETVGWLTVCVRGWLARVPWSSLALDWDGTRVVERCVVLGGLAPGLAEGVADAPRSTGGQGCLWVVDPGPPDGAWPPLFPSGYPDPLRAAAARGDVLAPDGLGLDADALAALLASRSWAQFAYLGHVAASPTSPAAGGLVLSGRDAASVFTAHAWLREPHRWPSPPRVALLGCGSDDAAPFEQVGLATAALRAGASMVTTTRWSLPNTPGTTALLPAVTSAHATDDPHVALRRWQLGELERWRRTAAADASPLLWAALVTYDLELLVDREWR